jgi:CheY-like chemotaxis protein
LAARVLIIEDDPDLRETLAELLRLNGYSVQTAANGQDALQSLRGNDLPRLILLDLMMPVMNGWEFRDALAKDPRLAQVPVVVLSGVDDTSEAADVRADGHLTKPVTLEAVLNAVQSHC